MAKEKGTAVFTSKVAEHIFLNGHIISRGKAKLVKHLRGGKKSLEIPKDALFNTDQSNGFAWLFKLVRRCTCPGNYKRIPLARQVTKGKEWGPEK